MRLKYFFVGCAFLSFSFPCKGVDSGSKADHEISHAEQTSPRVSQEGEEVGDSPAIRKSPVPEATRLAIHNRLSPEKVSNALHVEGPPPEVSSVETPPSLVKPPENQEGRSHSETSIAIDPDTPSVESMAEHVEVPPKAVGSPPEPLPPVLASPKNRGLSASP